MYNALFLHKNNFSMMFQLQNQHQICLFYMQNCPSTFNAMPIFYVLHAISCKCDSFTKSHKYGVRHLRKIICESCVEIP